MPDSTPKDLLTPKTAAIILAPFAAAVIAGRMHPEIVAPVTLTAAALCVLPIVDRVEAKRRMILGTIAAVLLCYTLAIIWPWGGPAVLVPVAVPVLAIWCIGSGHDKRTVPKATAYLDKVLEQNLPVGVTAEKGTKRGNGISYILKRGPNAPAGALNNFDLKVASAITGTKRGTVKLIDLGREVGEGFYRLDYSRDVAAFDVPAPERPAYHPDHIPLGWDEKGDVVWIDNRLHGMVAGETGSGKSNTLNVILRAAWERGDQLILIDPKETELFPWAPHARIYADTPTAMVDALKEVSAISRKRRLALRAKGRKNWTKEDGQYVTVVIDEMSELCDLCPQAKPLTSSLARLARSAGVQIWFADQYPTAETFPKSVKQNTPNVIGHRVKNGTAVRVLLDEDATKEGWNLADTTLPAGRAALAIQGRPRQWVQVFPDPGVPQAPSAPFTPPVTPSQPPINPTPYAGTMGRDDTITRDPVTPTCDPELGKHDGPVLDMLGSIPRTQGAIAAALKLHGTQVKRSLERLAEAGLAAKVEGGWVDPRMDPSADEEEGGDDRQANA